MLVLRNKCDECKLTYSPRWVWILFGGSMPDLENNSPFQFCGVECFQEFIRRRRDDRQNSPVQKLQTSSLKGKEQEEKDTSQSESPNRV
jgi:hypothetical protein